jgi:hypothetical protein
MFLNIYGVYIRALTVKIQEYTKNFTLLLYEVLRLKRHDSDMFRKFCCCCEVL